jgi:hypothetical protein
LGTRGEPPSISDNYLVCWLEQFGDRRSAAAGNPAKEMQLATQLVAKKVTVRQHRSCMTNRSCEWIGYYETDNSSMQ